MVVSDLSALGRECNTPEVNKTQSSLVSSPAVNTACLWGVIFKNNFGDVGLTAPASRGWLKPQSVLSSVG